METCPQCGRPLSSTGGGAPSRLTVADAMTRNPVTLGPEDSLMRVVELMNSRHIRRVPIVAGEQLLGIVAMGDVKRAEPSTFSSSEEEFNRFMETTSVSRIMISNPLTASPDTPLLEAARTLHTKKFGALPVLDGGRLVGILTDNDLLRCLVDLLTAGG